MTKDQLEKANLIRFELDKCDRIIAKVDQNDLDAVLGEFTRICNQEDFNQIKTIIRNTFINQRNQYQTEFENL